MSTLAFLGLKLLYALPVVGFFASLIFAIAPENRSLKHHALATFILRIVILGLLIFGGIRLWNNFDAVWEQITESVQVMTGDDDIESRDEGKGVGDLLNSLLGD